MPVRLFRLVVASIALLLMASVGAEPLSVFVSIQPQKYFVERVGGKHVRVSVMVGPGQSPATFEPRPRQMAGLARARLYYRIGVPFESVWMDRIRSTNPQMSILDARDGIRLRPIEGAGGSTEAAGRRPRPHDDPHIWLSPALVKIMAARLRDRLIELDPVHEADYQANTETFITDLSRLQQQIKQRLAGLKRRSFMVFHPSWGYFAAEFGLRQIPIESEGKGPGASTLGRLIDQARRQQIGMIFVQPQFSQTQARALAQSVGARLVTIDSLAEDYIRNLRQVAAAIAGSDDGD